MAPYNFYSVFILFMLITVEQLGKLLPCNIQDLFENNIYIKHILGIFTMLFFVTLSEDKENASENASEHISLEASLSRSVMMYAWFMLMTKTNKYIFIALLFLLAIAYLLSLKKKDILQSQVKPLASTPQNSNATNHTNHISHTSQQITQMELVVRYIYWGFMILTIFGVILYMGEKKLEYKNNFQYMTFFFGNSVCKNYSPKTSVLTALKHAFK